MFKRCMIFAAVLSLLLVVFTSCFAAGTATMYVKTDNGKSLNVRSSPQRGDNVIGSLKYGEAVGVDWSYAGNDGWTRVIWGGYGDAYVMSRFLVNEKPAAYKPSASGGSSSGKKSASSDQKAASTAESITVEQMNALVKGFTFVNPYEITVRPTRASGWVYMRWFPSRRSKEVATYGNGAKLLVLAELKDWYQVKDPESGKVGFLYKNYIH